MDDNSTSFFKSVVLFIQFVFAIAVLNFYQSRNSEIFYNFQQPNINSAVSISVAVSENNKSSQPRIQENFEVNSSLKRISRNENTQINLEPTTKVLSRNKPLNKPHAAKNVNRQITFSAQASENNKKIEKHSSEISVNDDLGEFQCPTFDELDTIPETCKTIEPTVR